jgi:uncharacterized protein (TIGR02996 family)
MSLEEAFLQAILQEPDEDVHCLVYADWLEERGDPRGEFIRVQCRLARLPANAAERPELLARQEELLEEHAGAWLGPLREYGSGWQFRRGFVVAGAVDWRLLNDAFFRLAPALEEVRYRDVGGQIVRAEGERRIVLRPRYDSPDLLARFRRFAEAVGRLNHPVIPRRRDAGEVDGRPYLVLPLPAGEDLVSVVGRRGPLPADEVARILDAVALALDHAHSYDVFHGELQPRHVLLAPAGRVWVTGLGAWRSEGEPAPEAEEELVLEEVDEPLDWEPDILPPSRQGDVPALAEIAFFLLTGRFASPADGARTGAGRQVPSLVQYRPDLAGAVDPVLRQALAPAPGDDLFSAGGFAQACGEALTRAAADGPKGIWAWNYEAAQSLRVLTDPAAGEVEFLAEVEKLAWLNPLGPEEAAPLCPAIPRLVAKLTPEFTDDTKNHVLHLLAIIGESCLPALRQALARDSARHRDPESILAALVRCGAAAEVAAMLTGADPDGRARAAAAFLAGGDMAVALPALEATLGDCEPRVRRAAAHTLIRRLGDVRDWGAQKRVLRSVLEVIARDNPPDGAYLLAEFRFWGGADSLLLFALKLRSYFPEPVRELAAKALGSFGRSSAHWLAPELEACVQHEWDERVRAAAAAALAKLRGEQKP